MDIPTREEFEALKERVIAIELKVGAEGKAPEKDDAPKSKKDK